MVVHSETDQLKKVIIHEPDFGIEKVTPEIAEELLYDDIVYLPRMIEEHRIFTSSLKHFLGADNVLEFEDLLVDVLKKEGVKSAVLDEVQWMERFSDEFKDALLNLPEDVLGFHLINGMYFKEEQLLPLPNLIFTRDLAVAINDHIVVCSANKKARIRESLLTSFVFKHHDLFQAKNAEGKIIDLYQAFKKDYHNLSLEGGDTMIIDQDNVFIGCSERTTQKGIDHLVRILLDRKIVKRVAVVNIPAERYCMHLDTIFTVIDKDACVGFKPLVFEPHPDVAIRQYIGSMHNFRLFKSVKDLIRSIYPDIKCIPCGGGKSPFQEREQWTDGSNLVAIKAGVFYGYDRNYHTSETLEDNGYQVESASLLNDQSDATMASIEKHLITVPSGELSRARGGSHCMTLPIERLP